MREVNVRLLAGNQRVLSTSADICVRRAPTEATEDYSPESAPAHNGGDGDDTYLYNPGDGNDTVTETAYHGVDTLKFGAGITADHVVVTRDGTSDDLTLSFSDQVGSIHLPGEMSGADIGVGRISFADGTNWSFDELSAKVLAGQETSGNDLVVGFNATPTPSRGASATTPSTAAAATTPTSTIPETETTPSPKPPTTASTHSSSAQGSRPTR